MVIAAETYNMAPVIWGWSVFLAVILAIVYMTIVLTYMYYNDGKMPKGPIARRRADKLELKKLEFEQKVKLANLDVERYKYLNEITQGQPHV